MLNPATSYYDNSLKPAIFDNEQAIDQFYVPTNNEIQVYDGQTRAFKGIINPTSKIKETTHLKTDYYIFSLSLEYNFRMFNEFAYDACLVIFDLEKFRNKLYDRLDILFPKWTVVAQPVKYIDEEIYEKEPDVCFCKNRRYSYQKEYRFICFPPEPYKKLHKRIIEVGCIRDIAVIMSKLIS